MSTDNIENKMNVSFLFAGGFGAFLAAIIDNFTNGSASITTKLMNRFLPHFNDASVQLIVAILVGITGAVLCWIYAPKTRPDAFVKGLTIFAALNIISPYQDTTSVEHNPETENLGTNYNLEKKDAKNVLISEASLFNFDFFQEQPKVKFKPDATIVKFSEKEWISSVKPYTTMSSYFTGEIYYQEKKGENLSQNQQVEIIDNYSTLFGKYQYTKIRYLGKNNEIKEGWIKKGSNSKWIYVKPLDNAPAPIKN
jgi:hypothetical protein